MRLTDWQRHVEELEKSLREDGATQTKPETPVPAAADPRLRRRRAEHRRRRGRRAWPPARRRGRQGRRALHPRQPELHPRPAVRGPRAALRRLAPGGQAPGRGGAAAGPRRRGPAWHPDRHGRRGSRRLALVGVPLDEGQARARLEALAPRGHPRRHDRLVPQPRGRPHGAARDPPAGDSAPHRVRPAAGGRRSRSPARLMATLYRCRTPTNVLCPCGRVARELRRHGIEADEVRVARRRRDRDEVAAPSGQRVVPMPVLAGGAICDSRQIVEPPRWPDRGSRTPSRAPAAA